VYTPSNLGTYFFLFTMPASTVREISIASSKSQVFFLLLFPQRGLNPQIVIFKVQTVNIYRHM
jgi:hypothetical protein